MYFSTFELISFVFHFTIFCKGATKPAHTNQSLWEGCQWLPRMILVLLPWLRRRETPCVGFNGGGFKDVASSVNKDTIEFLSPNCIISDRIFLLLFLLCSFAFYLSIFGYKIKIEFCHYWQKHHLRANQEPWWYHPQMQNKVEGGSVRIGWRGAQMCPIF